MTAAPLRARLRLPWTSARVPLAVVIGLVLTLAAVVTFAILMVDPAPAQSVPAGHLPLHTTPDRCTVVHPGSEC